MFNFVISPDGEHVTFRGRIENADRLELYGVPSAGGPTSRMTTTRRNRRGMPLEKVVSIFNEGRGSQWAPDVVDTLLNAPDVMIPYALRETAE